MIDFLKNIFPPRIETATVRFLVECLSKLPDETYGIYVRQLLNGLLKYSGDTELDHPSFRNYVGFTYDPKVSKIFEDPSGRFSRVKDILVKDRSGSELTSVSIYFSHGLVCGYAFENRRDFDTDLTTIDVTGAKLEFLDAPDAHVEGLIEPKDRYLINWSDVFEVELEGIIYYHLIEIGDGDFVGVDRNRQLYEIRHDPFEVKPLDGSLRDILNRVNGL